MPAYAFVKAAQQCIQFFIRKWAFRGDYKGTYILHFITITYIDYALIYDFIIRNKGGKIQ